LTEGDPVTRAAFEEATWSARDARTRPRPDPGEGCLPAFRRRGLRSASYDVGASGGPRSSRCLDPRGWTLLFAGVRFG